jgi:hypothetical protein
MAFGFSPKHIRDFNLDGLDKEHFLLIAVKAASKLDWGIYFISDAGIMADTKTSWTSFGEKITVKINGGVANLKSECSGSQIIDFGKNKKNIEDLIETIDEIKAELTREEIESELPALRSWYPSREDDILGHPLTTKEKVTGCLYFFKPVEGYFIPPILISINILLFVAMLVSGVNFLMPEQQSLLDWGANFRLLTLDGQWWRLFTACFLHIGVVHLLLNMYALFYGNGVNPLKGIISAVLPGIVWKKFACFFPALRCFCNAKGAKASQRAQGLRVLCEERAVTGLEGLTRSFRRPCAKASQRTRSLCALCEASAPLAVKKHRDAVKNRTVAEPDFLLQNRYLQG